MNLVNTSRKKVLALAIAIAMLATLDYAAFPRARIQWQTSICRIKRSLRMTAM